jgi:hypothetical protein
VLNEGGENNRITDALVPGYRFIDTNNTDQANYFQNNFYDSSKPILTFNIPLPARSGRHSVTARVSTSVTSMACKTPRRR